jgi:hypothetical protein
LTPTAVVATVRPEASVERSALARVVKVRAEVVARPAIVNPPVLVPFPMVEDARA